MFELGDVVKFVGIGQWVYVDGEEVKLAVGTIFTVVEEGVNGDQWFDMEDRTVEIGCTQHWPDDFELVVGDESAALEWPEPAILGVYRPNLEDRKVGKVQMHMVDDGFPNALKEIAKVMTWAAEVKGYKLHDWKNLPNAAEDFPSAAYRHRTENSIQKAAGLPALERVDHESAIVHKAHELFNGLAELELILTGKII